MSKIFRRSEVEHALNLARKARRRGDMISAERWLKHVDRHLAVEARSQSLKETDMRNNAKRDADLAHDSEERHRKEQERRWLYLERELDKIDAMYDEELDDFNKKRRMDLRLPGASLGKNT